MIIGGTMSGRSTIERLQQLDMGEADPV